MVSLTSAGGRPRAELAWPFAVRLALRDFRGGFRGYFIFLASIALGVAAITGVGSVSLSLKDGLARQGRVILGGDVAFDLPQRALPDAERFYLAGKGRLAVVALMRAMARGDDGESALVEIKAVDGAYPLTDGPSLDPPLALADALAARESIYGMAADAALLARLHLAPGSRLSIGSARFELRAVLRFEPDRLASGIRFGSPVLISQEALKASGLIQPGALVKWQYRIDLGNASESQIAALIEEAKQRFPEAGWDIRTRTNIYPQLSRNLDRFTEFLTLVGLTSLIVGGVGVANAVRGFVERKRQTIATLKALGAAGGTVFVLMLTQTMLVAAAGAALGAALGAVLPFFAASALGPLLPFPVAPAIHPPAILKGLLYGLLTALAFSAAPLGHAHDIPVQALFRAGTEPRRGLPRPRYLTVAAVAALGLIAAVLGFAADRRLVLIYLGATLGAFALLRGASLLIASGAKRLPHARSAALRLAIGNIHRPGALTPSAVLSLGLGLSLLVALGLTSGSIKAELQQPGARKAPSFFFLDVPAAGASDFAGFLKDLAPDGETELVPMMRGRIVRLNGVPASQIHPKQSAAWALEGDRGITFSKEVPAGSSIVSGSWWPEDYAGPPLVSVEDGIAEGLGLAVGSEVTVNVLGREITARVASTRRVNWRSYGINFVLVFPPSSFSGAPYHEIATLTLPGGAAPEREAAIQRAAARAFPAVTAIRVKDALDAVSAVAGQLAFAVRIASGAAFLASILVIGGALAAGQEARIHDAVVLKTLGATRARLVASYLYEFGIIGICAALFGVAAGTAAAYGIARGVMDLDFVFIWQEALAGAAAALCVMVLLGLSGTWRVLGRKPAPYLREL